MAIQPDLQVSSVSLEGLYCEEEKWMEEEHMEDEFYPCSCGDTDINGSLKVRPFHYPSSFLVEEAMFWDEEELVSLLSKEKEQHEKFLTSREEESSSLSSERKDAVEWILKVNTHYGFSPLTSVLALNYLDRFLLSTCYRRDMPWMIELVAIACLSLAAKVEETEVPLLLSFQVEKTKYYFKAKDIQSMELLILSTLKWQMHPVTPISFLDHIIRRLKLKTHLHWEFLRQCEEVIISLVSDSRSVFIIPSEIAASAMLHVIKQIEPFSSMEYQSQLLGTLKTSKEKAKQWSDLILTLPRISTDLKFQCKSKRKYEQEQLLIHHQESPSGVIDADVFNHEVSNDSWAVEEETMEPTGKKRKPY